MQAEEDAAPLLEALRRQAPRFSEAATAIKSNLTNPKELAGYPQLLSELLQPGGSLLLSDSLSPAIECVLSLGFPQGELSQGERWALNTLRRCCVASDTPSNLQARALVAALGVTELEISSAFAAELSRTLSSTGATQDRQLLLETALHVWDRGTPELVAELLQPLCAQPPTVLVERIVAQQCTGSVYTALSVQAKASLWESSVKIWCMELAALVQLAQDSDAAQLSVASEPLVSAMRCAPQLSVLAINELLPLLLLTGSAAVLATGRVVVEGVLARRQRAGAMSSAAFFPVRLRALAAHLVTMPLYTGLPEIATEVELLGREAHAFVLLFQGWSALVCTAGFQAKRPVDAVAGLQLLAWRAWPQQTATDRSQWAEGVREHVVEFTGHCELEAPSVFCGRFQKLLQQLQLERHPLVAKQLLSGCVSEQHEGALLVLEQLQKVRVSEGESPWKRHKGS